MDHAFIVDGRLVAATYFNTMGAAMASVIGKVECPVAAIGAGVHYGAQLVHL